MYGGKGAGVAGTATGAVVAATVLPNTGGADTIITLAVSIFAGLIAWGATYAIVNK